MAFSWHPWIPGTLKLDSILRLFKCESLSISKQKLYGKFEFDGLSFVSLLRLKLVNILLKFHKRKRKIIGAYTFFSMAWFAAVSSNILTHKKMLYLLSSAFLIPRNLSGENDVFETVIIWGFFLTACNQWGVKKWDRSKCVTFSISYFQKYIPSNER